MRKAWVYKRKKRGGQGYDWYLMWYDKAMQVRSRKCQNATDANRQRMEMEHQLNNSQGAMPARTEWQDHVDAYLSFKTDVRHKEPATIKSARDTLNNFKRLVGPVPSPHMNQSTVNRFVKERSGAGTAPATVNKDLRHHEGVAARIVLRENPVRAVLVLAATAGDLHGDASAGHRTPDGVRRAHARRHDEDAEQESSQAQ
jgi:hypothetical protein